MATIRNTNDLYPTPPCAALALRAVLELDHPLALECDTWLDPSAGFGTLLEWSGIRLPQRRAIELSTSPTQLAELQSRLPAGHARSLLGVDALALQEWPCAHIIANPPFSLLEEFVNRILEHRERVRREIARHPIACILMPMQWWHAQSRASIARPDWMFALGWRPNFSAGFRPDGTDGSGPSQDYVWAVYDGRTALDTRWRRIERPRGVPPDWVREHERLARIGCELPATPAPLLERL